MTWAWAAMLGPIFFWVRNLTDFDERGLNMKRTIKIYIIVAILTVMVFILSSCHQADVVRQNLKREADDFNIRRRITVMNTRTDTPLMQITGVI